MNALIKKIRNLAGLSQQELADRLGVTFATINRWENARAVPNRMAQEKLYDFCRESAVPVYDMLLQRIWDETNNIQVSGGRMLLFHGSKAGIEGRIAPLSRDKCDFGAGFYMGTDPMQPLTLTCDYDKAKFYIVSVDMNGLRCLDIPAGLEWAMVVAYNRGKLNSIKGTAMYEKYRALCENKDIIIGSIADDRMFYVLDNFFQGNITDTALVKSLSALGLGRQYAAKTQTGCDAVRIEKQIPLCYLEKRCLRDVSQTNRVKGISLADSICRDYRREGLFFDEIIDRAKEE